MGLSKEDKANLVAELSVIAPQLRVIKSRKVDFIINKLYRWTTCEKRQIHQSKNGWFFMHCKERDSVFRTAKEFQKTVTGLIETDHTFSIKNKETKAYRPTDKATQLITRFLIKRMDEPKHLVDRNGNKISRPLNAIASRDNENQNKAIKGNIRSLQPINRGNVAELLRVIQEDRRKVSSGQCSGLERLKKRSPQEQIQFLDRLIASSIATLYHSNYQGYEDHMPLYYIESAAGRIVGQGFNLQNAPREVKQAAFAGYYDYDIKNCHITLAAQLGRREGVKVDQLDWYIDLKSDKRRFIELAEQFGADPATLKRAMLAIIYGAALVDFKEFALSKMLYEFTEDFIRHPEVRRFEQQAKAIRQTVTANAKQKPGFIINHLGKRLSINEKVDSQFAHELQAYEAQMLHHLIDLHADRVRLFSHDGFVANDQIDTDEIATLYKASTGLEIEFTRDLIIAPRLAA